MTKQIDLLFDKNNNIAYKAMLELQKESERSNAVYPYMDQFIEMMDSANSYIRARGLLLIACNAQWDINYKIDKIISRYLQHITDAKPTTARQCIKALPVVVKFKPDLRQDIIATLQKADIAWYTDSMRPLICKDIQEALEKIQKEEF